MKSLQQGSSRLGSTQITFHCQGYMDLKVMPISHQGHKYILCIIDEVTNYLITVPIYQAKSEEIGEALINNVITKYCISEYIIMDWDSAFMSSFMTYLLGQI